MTVLREIKEDLNKWRKYHVYGLRICTNEQHREFYHDTPNTGKHCRITKDGFNLLYNGIILEAGKVLFRNYVCILNFQFYEYETKHKMQLS